MRSLFFVCSIIQFETKNKRDYFLGGTMINVAFCSCSAKKWKLPGVKYTGQGARLVRLSCCIGILFLQCLARTHKQHDDHEPTGMFFAFKAAIELILYIPIHKDGRRWLVLHPRGQLHCTHRIFTGTGPGPCLRLCRVLDEDASWMVMTSHPHFKFCAPMIDPPGSKETGFDNLGTES